MSRDISVDSVVSNFSRSTKAGNCRASSNITDSLQTRRGKQTFQQVRIHMASQFSVHVYVKNLPVGISSDCDVHRSIIKKASDGRVGKKTEKCVAGVSHEYS